MVTVSNQKHIKGAQNPSKMHAFGGIDAGNTRSSNDKEDVITTQLQQFAIALRVLSKYPAALKDFCLAVNNGAI
jgi:hypothetical protein